MAWKEITYRLKSSAPLIQHNGQLADPTNKWSKLIKQISGKRNKTDADFEEMAHLEFLGSLYLGETGPVIPQHVADGVMIRGAMKFKKGPAAKSGCFCLMLPELEYEGPRSAEELWEDERFHFAALVRVGQARVMRMRPIFREWGAVITLTFEDTICNPAEIGEWLVKAGTDVGLGDWRPQYGRFTVEKLNGK